MKGTVAKPRTVTLATAPVAAKATPASPMAKRKPLASGKPTPAQCPEKFTYRLECYTAELRATGWFIARTTYHDAKPESIGPYALIENAAYAIARRLIVEMADRHTKMVERYGLDRTHKLYGLKKTTRPQA